MEMALGGKVMGTLLQGAAGLEAGKYNRDVLNAQARDELIVADAEARRVAQASRAQMGAQLADQAESGFVPATGTSLKLLEESAIAAELDILNIRRAAQGRNAALRTQAQMARKEGRFAMTASMMKAGSQIAEAISGAHGNYGG